MSFSYQFGSLTAWTSGWLDTNFNEAGLLGTIPSTVSGTNVLTLTPYTAPTIGTPPFSLQPQVRVSGIAQATNTGAATAAVGGTAALSIYKDTSGGPVALTGGEIVLGNLFTLTYDASLNGGAGGYHLGTAPASAAGTVASVGTGTGLTGGPITSNGTISLASIANSQLLSNISGSSAAPVPNSLTGILDAIMSNAQGSIISRGGSVWAANTEATWTPVLAFGGASSGITYGTQSGYYMQIGYLVIAFYAIILTSYGSSTGAATISLPVTAGGGNRVGGGIVASYSGLTSLTTLPWAYVAPSATTAALYVAGSATTTAVLNSNFANNATLSGILVYLAG